MFRKYYIPLILICLYLLIASSSIFAATRVEVLFYTGKIVVTSKNNEIRTFTMPQPVSDIPMDTTVECLDGVAIINVGDVQVSIGRKDKLKLASKVKGDKVDIICLAGEIKALSGENLFKIDKGQKLGLNNQGIAVIENEENEGSEGSETVIVREILDEQTQITSTVTPDDDPDEDIYSSPNF